MLEKMTVGSLVRDCCDNLLLIVRVTETETHYEWEFALLGENKFGYEKSFALPKQFGRELIEEGLQNYEFVS